MPKPKSSQSAVPRCLSAMCSAARICPKHPHTLEALIPRTRPPPIASQKFRPRWQHPGHRRLSGERGTQGVELFCSFCSDDRAGSASTHTHTHCSCDRHKSIAPGSNCSDADAVTLENGRNGVVPIFHALNSNKVYGAPPFFSAVATSLPGRCQHLSAPKCTERSQAKEQDTPGSRGAPSSKKAEGSCQLPDPDKRRRFRAYLRLVASVRLEAVVMLRGLAPWSIVIKCSREHQLLWLAMLGTRTTLISELFQTHHFRALLFRPSPPFFYTYSEPARLAETLADSCTT